MSDAAPRKAKQPKLRASCDACGAAKLKCDRGHPECSRCLSNGLTCHYGLSRKMGKPPRDRLHRQSISQSRTAMDGGLDKLGHHDSHDQSLIDAELFPSVHEVPAWDGTISGHPPGGLLADLDALGHLGAPPLPFLSLEFGDELIADNSKHSMLASQMDFPSISAPDSPPMDRIGSTPTEPSARARALGGLKDHDCPREAYSILGSLSSLPLSRALGRPAGNSDPGVALDHLLRVNRGASERLTPLLACSCTRFPALALLYASILSWILIWYQEAAGCVTSGSPGLPCIPLDGAISPASSTGVGHGASGWSSTTGSGPGEREAPGPSTPTLVAGGMVPVRMAIGSFNIDDLRVQSALRTQLVLGEMGRVRRLIDAFSTCQDAGPRLGDGWKRGGVEGLHQSLASWLREEHARIANALRAQLKELNTPE